MTESTAIQQPDHHSFDQETFSKTILGFWVYLMTDCLIFTTLFATYGVLHTSTFGGPTSQQLFKLATPFAETLILLVSSFACGLGTLAALQHHKHKIIAWFSLAFLSGLAFVVLELNEFTHLVREGNSWQNSAFLSSFFTLVGTHGLHVSIGLLWMIVLIVQIIVSGLNVNTFRRLICFNMFWHFLDLVWIFIFTFVYLMGVI